MRDPNEPVHDLNDRRCLILELPELSDEAALQLSELLQQLAEHFDTCYDNQILRAHRAREHEYHALYREQCVLQAQQSLPFDDAPF
ncbi:MAG: hypothetical protein ACRELE_10525 [Gemmatimonadales bacterium]